LKHVLLHICCGPCATHVIETLAFEYAVTGYFCNPNLYPQEEYSRRLEAAIEVCARNNIPFVEDPPDHDEFLEAVRGLEEEPENGARCLVCYRLRLERAARAAAWSRCDYMASTLTVGPMKKAAVINPIGAGAAERNSVIFIEADWKKRDGFRRSCELSREMGIYRQHYCGCEFSRRDMAYQEDSE
jgi:epoxyqueuosine reductase